MENLSSLFKYKISGASGFAVVLLVLVLVGLGERILYDLSRFFVGDNFSYFNDLSTLLVHTLFVTFLIVVAVVINVAIAENKRKYAIVLIPYFVLAIALTIQVALEAAAYFYFHHTQFQFYLVMSNLVIISSVLIYFVQKRYVPVEMSGSDSYHGSWITITFWILGVFIWLPLILFTLAIFYFRGSY